MAKRGIKSVSMGSTWEGHFSFAQGKVRIGAYKTAPDAIGYSDVYMGPGGGPYAQRWADMNGMLSGVPGAAFPRVHILEAIPFADPRDLSRTLCGKDMAQQEIQVWKDPLSRNLSGNSGMTCATCERAFRSGRPGAILAEEV